jgi:hypothetical protein
VIEPPLQITFVRAAGDTTAPTNAICRGGTAPTVPICRGGFITSRPYSAFSKKNNIHIIKSDHSTNIIQIQI